MPHHLPFLLLLLLTHSPTLSCARGPFCALWIFYTNTILQMSEWESIKTLALWFYFSPPERERRKKVQERRILLFPLSVCSTLFLLHSIPFILIQQSIIFRKRVSEEGREKSGDCRWKWYFFSCSYPSAFEPAMWKSARSTALHSSLPLIKSRQSGLNQHAKCHSTL